MNANATNGPWRQFRIQLRMTWSRLTDADLVAISRNNDELVRVVQRRYGCERNEPAVAAVQVLLSEIACLTAVCRRLPISVFASECGCR